MKADPEIISLVVTNRNKRGKEMAHYKLMGVDAQGKRHYLKFIDRQTVCELLINGGSTVEWEVTNEQFTNQR